MFHVIGIDPCAVRKLSNATCTDNTSIRSNSHTIQKSETVTCLFNENVFILIFSFMSTHLLVLFTLQQCKLHQYWHINRTVVRIMAQCGQRVHTHMHTADEYMNGGKTVKLDWKWERNRERERAQVSLLTFGITRPVFVDTLQSAAKTVESTEICEQANNNKSS